MPGGIHPPLAVIATWPAPSLDPIQRGWNIPIVLIIFTSITFLVVVARLWARLVVQKNPGLDDIVIVLAMIPLLGLTVTLVGSFRYWGFDRHAWDLPRDGKLAIASRKVVLAIEVLYTASTGLTKISILLFYRRLASGTISPTFHWAVRCAIIFVTVSTIAFIMAPIFGCKPLNAFWNQVSIPWILTHVEGRDYRCFNEAADLLSAAAVSILQDFVACIMPMVLFWKLQLPRRQKIALGSLFVVGFFTCICAIMRITYIYEIFYKTYDVTWATGPAWLWTGLEATLGVICASVPALKVFFPKYLNVTIITGSISQTISSLRNRTTRNMSTSLSKDEKPRSSFSYAFTTKTGGRSKTSTNFTENDLELGKIAVTEEVEIASAYGDATKDGSQSGMQAPATRDSSSSSKPLQQGLIRRDFDTTWLDLDANESPSPDRGKRKSVGDLF